MFFLIFVCFIQSSIFLCLVSLWYETPRSRAGQAWGYMWNSLAQPMDARQFNKSKKKQHPENTWYPSDMILKYTLVRPYIKEYQSSFYEVVCLQPLGSRLEPRGWWHWPCSNHGAGERWMFHVPQCILLRLKTFCLQMLFPTWWVLEMFHHQFSNGILCVLLRSPSLVESSQQWLRMTAWRSQSFRPKEWGHQKTWEISTHLANGQPSSWGIYIIQSSCIY